MGYERIGLTDAQLALRLRILRQINRLCDEEIISGIERIEMYDIIVPGIWGKDKALYMRMYRQRRKLMKAA